MKYTIDLKPRATKDLSRIPKPDAGRILDAVAELCNNLSGDVKHLTNFTPEYRLRVGDYRVLFEIEKTSHVVVYRVRHRRDVYRN
jgi:mRNA interferase RelE/StbE